MVFLEVEDANQFWNDISALDFFEISQRTSYTIRGEASAL